MTWIKRKFKVHILFIDELLISWIVLFYLLITRTCPPDILIILCPSSLCLVFVVHEFISSTVLLFFCLSSLPHLLHLYPYFHFYMFSFKYLTPCCSLFIFQDLLRCRVLTSGIFETRFQIDKVNFQWVTTTFIYRSVGWWSNSQKRSS